MSQGQRIEKYSLDNGLTVVLENIPHRSSATVGIWVPVGSRFESDKEMGYSHFTEHMLFKGTAKRSYSEIARAIDRLGGYMNASTSREITDYYVTLSGRHLETALDVLSDMYFNSIFADEEYKSEKNVIIEEIKMSEDSPDDYLFDLFYLDALGDNSLGRPIAGTEESIRNSTRDDLYQYYRSKYGTQGTVLSMAGALWENTGDLDKLKKKIDVFFNKEGTQLSGKPSLIHAPPEIAREKRTRPGIVKHYKKKLEQLNFVIGLPGLKQEAEQDPELHVFTHLIGGTMSSRLFQVLREQHGLCYSVNAFHNQYLSEGIWGIYCGTSKKTFFKAVELALEETRKTILGNLSDEQVEETKSGLSGMLELGLESSVRRANFNAKNLLYYNELIDWKKIISKIEQTNPGKILSYMQTMWANFKPSVTSLGNLDPDKTIPKLTSLMKNLV